MPRSFLKTRESAPLALTLTKIRVMAPQTHHTGLSLSCKSKKNASINANSWNRNGSAHAMKDMNCRCVSSARPLTDVSATIHHSNGAYDESNNSQTQRTETNVQRTSTGPHAKTRPPEPMAADITLRELAAWRRSWEDFLELEQLDRLPARQQRAMLRTSLSIEMRATLQLAIGIDNDDDITVTAILDRIQEHVRSKQNVTLDRIALEERKQEEGEPFDQFYIALREIANNADLCQHCIDDRLPT